MARMLLNPFRPGAGHTPPYLAGREREADEFRRLLQQDVILENTVLTGLRGVGKTVLLDTFKPLAIEHGWWFVGADLSESTSISEERLALRLLTDVSGVTASIPLAARKAARIGFAAEAKPQPQYLDFEALAGLYRQTPGLASDKMRTVLDFVWQRMKGQGKRGIVFAYDEAQNLTDHAAKGEYPLALMLDVFQSLQKQNVPFMLVLSGLPTLFPKLVESRTFAERMFRVLFLDRLDERQCHDAILKPLEDSGYLPLSDWLVAAIVRESGGYPYFLQFIAREIVDIFLQVGKAGKRTFRLAMDSIIHKLDTDFFAGRWARTTDRQQELLSVISQLPNCEDEFSVQQVVERSQQLPTRPFRASRVSQMLSTLCDAGLVYRNRHGKYSFAVPLLGRFIARQQQPAGSSHE
jgi:hypothetical protein